MSLFAVSFSYLTSRLYSSILNIVMMASGIMLITILLLFGYQIQQRLGADSKGIDAVIGAKGSPLQLVLSTIYHLDVPTGNIDIKMANKIKRHPQIKRVIPISLGDSYQGFRIVGTNPSYIKHFDASFETGNIWQNNMQAVIGSDVAKHTNLKVGNHFSGSHGLVQGGEMHAEKTYSIVGVLQPTKTVLDRLIITSLESVWNIHHHHMADEMHENETEENQEITALLIHYKHKMAAITFPRYINKNTNIQAASPSFEIARLIKLIGFSKDSVILFGGFLIILSLSSMLIGLLNSVDQRRYDLAIFRTLGASKNKIFFIVIIEGMMISFIGSLIGLIAGHFAIEIIGHFSAKGTQLGLTGFILLPQIFILWASMLLLCFVICLIPATRAYNTDIKKILTHVP